MAIKTSSSGTKNRSPCKISVCSTKHFVNFLLALLLTFGMQAKEIESPCDAWSCKEESTLLQFFPDVLKKKCKVTFLCKSLCGERKWYAVHFLSTYCLKSMCIIVQPWSAIFGQCRPTCVECCMAVSKPCNISVCVCNCRHKYLCTFEWRHL